MEIKENRGRVQGFAAMDKERLREICSMGGKKAHELGLAHRWVAGSEEVKEAGRRGGSKSKRRPKQ